MTIGRKDSQVKRASSFDPTGAALTEAVGIEPEHALYLLLYGAAATARQHRLPINLDTIAFTIARTPALSERWTARKQSEDTLAQRITDALREYVTPAEQEAA
jgi:hypothetical protein